MKWFYNEIINDFSLEKWIFMVVVAIMMMAIYLFCTFLFRKDANGLKKIIIAEETMVIMTVTTLLLTVFKVHIAIILWIGFYFLYAGFEVSNRIVKYYYLHPCRNFNKASFEKMITKSDDKKLFALIHDCKSQAVKKTKKELIEKKQWNDTRVSIRQYSYSLIIFSVVGNIWGWEYNNSVPFFFRYLGVLLSCSGIVICIYKILYFLVVEGGIKAVTPGGFKLVFVLYTLLYAMIVFAMMQYL